jgi:hypothetical protein
MEKTIGFRITAEFDCLDMIDEKIFYDEYGGDIIAAYKFISDNFSDSPFAFSSDDRIVKVELLRWGIRSTDLSHSNKL